MDEEIYENEEIVDELIKCSLDEALKYCIDCFKETSRLEFLLFTGKVYLYMEDYINAISYVDMAFQLGCDYFTYGNTVKGEAYYNLGMYKESKECFNKVINENPENFNITTYIIDIDIIEGKYEDAINLAVDFIEVYGFNKEEVAELKALIGWLYLDVLFDEKLAKEAFEEAIDDDDKCYSAYSGLGYYNLYNKRFREAIIYFDNAIKSNTEDEISYLGLALTYKELEEYDYIEKNLLQANIINPSNVKILIEYGYEMLRQDRIQEAIEIFNSVLEINPNDKEIKELVKELNY